jgi:hypothetical protein
VKVLWLRCHAAKVATGTAGFRASARHPWVPGDEFATGDN